MTAPDSVSGPGTGQRPRSRSTALADGRTSNARRFLVEVLDRYPDDALARFLLDRSREIESSGVDYGPYRAELAVAEAAVSPVRRGSGVTVGARRTRWNLRTTPPAALMRLAAADFCFC